jgi:Mor family transcriptional regulator
VDEDAIVADYGEGHDVESIARKYGVTAERVYDVVQRILADEPQPPTGPAPPW